MIINPTTPIITDEPLRLLLFMRNTELKFFLSLPFRQRVGGMVEVTSIHVLFGASLGQYFCLSL